MIGYCASYGGRYYDGGYGRDKTGKRNIYAERVVNLKEQALRISEIELFCRDYKEYLQMNVNGALIYVDPPYAETKQYDKQKMNYEEFYAFCREMSKNNIVVISEYQMPEDFECIWEKERKVMQKSDRKIGDKAVEKLFILRGEENE